VRIFVKECRSLAEAGFETYLVAPGECRIIDNVTIVGVGEKPANRVKRMFLFSRTVIEAALKLNCDLYHLHDPELLPHAKRIKKNGKIVVFDSHEDVPAQILSKHWISKWLRKLISSLYRRIEDRSLYFLDAVVAATNYIGQQFDGRAKQVAVVNNYPRLDDIVYQEKPFEERPKIACYVGGISAMRGEEVMKEAVRSLDLKLVIAGDHEVKVENNTHYVGRLTRTEVNSLYATSRVGFVLFFPEPNHINAQPNKLFEYMAAGLPFVASNFELWKSIIKKYPCGICVNPENVEEVRNACNLLVNNPKLAENMGRLGRKAVVNDYNWDNEVVSLIQLYMKLNHS
jgi:glycosyltransferase involved in cell wall biosynthesis